CSKSTPPCGRCPERWVWVAICGTAKPWPPGLNGGMGSVWECDNVSACSGSWVSACANRAPRLPGPIRNGSRPIKKTPSVDGRSQEVHFIDGPQVYREDLP